MSGWQRLAMGFALGGVLMLFLHPGSRKVMTYALQSDRVGQVLSADALVREPLEMFPPLRPQEMTPKERYLIAYRIARRLNQPSINAAATDLQAASGFVAQCAELEPDNAFWGQFQAALAVRSGDIKSAAALWSAAHEKTSWSPGTATLVNDLWNRISATEGIRFAWQGLCAGGYADDSLTAFIGNQMRRVANRTLTTRYDTLANADTILRDVGTFADGRRAAGLANIATFNSDLPLKTHSRSEVEQIRSAFASQVGAELGNKQASRTRRAMRSVETWESFVQPGETEKTRAIERLRIESVVTSTLPSALLVTSLIMAAVALLGKLLYQLFENVPHLDSRLLIALAVTLGGFLFIKTGILLVALWVVALGLLVGIPIPVGRPEPLPFGLVARLLLRMIAIVCFVSLAGWFVLSATPAKYLGYSASGNAFLGVAIASVSLALPIGAVLARVKERGVLSAIGDCLSTTGTFAAILGLFVTIVSTPICLYRDAQNRGVVQQWTKSECDLFRAGAE